MTRDSDTPPAMPTPDDLIFRNEQWAVETEVASPGYFDRLAEGQHPAIVWIGCADSRVPPSVVTDMGPGELFVHRNVANLVPALPARPKKSDKPDANSGAVIEYSIGVLKAHHVVVCGHTGCGGVEAALTAAGFHPETPQNDPPGVPLDCVVSWIDPIIELAKEREADLAPLPWAAARDLLVVLNTVRQVANAARHPAIKHAFEVEGRNIDVRGMIFDLKSGRLTDTPMRVTKDAAGGQLAELEAAAFAEAAVYAA